MCRQPSISGVMVCWLLRLRVRDGIDIRHIDIFTVVVIVLRVCAVWGIVHLVFLIVDGESDFSCYKITKINYFNVMFCFLSDRKMTPTVEPIVQPGMRPDTFFYHIENGFYFHESGKRHGNIYFKCVHAGKACRGRATYDPFAGFSMNGQHNHDPDPHYGDEIALMRKILARSLGNASFKSILLEEGRRWVDGLHSIFVKEDLLYTTLMLILCMPNCAGLPQR